MESYDETTPLPSSEVPEGWSFIKDIFNEAHLPKLGLPARWDATQQRQILTAFDPITKRTINLETGEEKKTVKDPVRFIESTAGKFEMPGTESPAAVRYTRYMEPALHDSIVKGGHGEELIPCIAHGDYVKVEALQSDHLQAKEEIQKRQIALVERVREKIHSRKMKTKKSARLRKPDQIHSRRNRDV